MAANDIYYGNVRQALINDGFTITHSPLRLSEQETTFKIDLACERGPEKIAVEIKSFLSESFVSDIHLAIGQTLNYTYMLSKKGSNRTLYLEPYTSFADVSISIYNYGSLIFYMHDKTGNRLAVWLGRFF